MPMNESPGKRYSEEESSSVVPLQAALYSEEVESDEVPRLFQLLEERIGTDVSDVHAWSTNTLSIELASLTPLIVSAAEADDALANSLLERDAEHCQRPCGDAFSGLYTLSQSYQWNEA